MLSAVFCEIGKEIGRERARARAGEREREREREGEREREWTTDEDEHYEEDSFSLKGRRDSLSSI